MAANRDLHSITKRDPIGTYDPLLAAVSSKGDQQFYRGGYFLWPNPRKAEAAKKKLMTIGNSTSLWPDSDWSRQLGQILINQGYDVGIYHGAGKGNTSSQDLLRVVRDAAAIKPNLIVSLSGICDIGFLLNSKNYPFAHKYTRRFLDYLIKYDFASEIVYGYPDTASPANIWCRNQSIAKVVAENLNATYITFLQPVMGYGEYNMTIEETINYNRKASTVLQAIGKPYGICLNEFYNEVRNIISEKPEYYRHIYDYSDIFANLSGAYRDHRHQSPAGVAHLAKQISNQIILLFANEDKLSNIT
ncbi:MAG: hypothetical protein WED82_11280 [Balneolales bacterium]